jgi:hypothetical protein
MDVRELCFCFFHVRLFVPGDVCDFGFAGWLVVFHRKGKKGTSTEAMY